MNKLYGAVLALFFLFGIGAFNIAMGATKLNKKRSKKWICWFRISMGGIMILVSFYLFYFFQSAGAF